MGHRGVGVTYGVHMSRCSTQGTEELVQQFGIIDKAWHMGHIGAGVTIWAYGSGCNALGIQDQVWHVGHSGAGASASVDHHRVQPDGCVDSEV